jgi:hypothetical protein
MNWSTTKKDGMGMDKFDKKNKEVQPTPSKERRGILWTFIDRQNGFDKIVKEIHGEFFFKQHINQKRFLRKKDHAN